MENTFQTLNLNMLLIEGLRKQNIINPTEIQQLVIPKALENKDIIGQSQTGSGKTLAYLIPIFEKINVNSKDLQALILAPTVELAMQVEKQISMLAINSQIKVTSASIFGQVNIKRQLEKLKEKPHIIVATPGRVLELIQLRKINTQTIKTLVIDEADRLLDKNNIEDILSIIKTTLKTRQLMLFSATINDNIIKIASDFMNSPEIIQISELKVSPTISHLYFEVEDAREKIEVLRKLIASIKPERALVFLNKSELIETLTEKLRFHNYEAIAIFGTATKEERQQAIQGFRSGKVKILIASDIAARGLDIDNLTHVFNFDVPQYAKDYLHRVGRTGRMGKEGTAISIVTSSEKQFIMKFEKELKIKVLEKVIYKGIIQDKYKN